MSIVNFGGGKGLDLRLRSSFRRAAFLIFKLREIYDFDAKQNISFVVYKKMFPFKNIFVSEGQNAKI